jgi:hypothetical protein
MPASVAELQARLDRLKKMRAAGVLSTRHGDSETRYRSLDELTRAIGMVEKEIDDAGGKAVPTTYLITSSKGL